MKKLVVVLSICLVLLLGVCIFLEMREVDQPLPETEVKPEMFNVLFKVQGKVISEQNLVSGEKPKQIAVELTDGLLVGWKTVNGQTADPFNTPVDRNIVYQAEIRPVLSNHTPYLFVNSEGLLRPDLPLTRQSFSQAMEALATDEAQLYFPEFLVGSVAITWEELVDQLSYFFEADAIAVTFPQTQSITRGEFAKGMNQLLDRSEKEYISLPDEYIIPSDITMGRQDAYALLEASMEHTPADQGLEWSQIDLPTTYAPGFLNIDGCLYYVQEDGYLLRNDHIGTLYFGSDGRYTSSDTELDEMVANLLREMIGENPNADRFELLRVIFDHCHQNYKYRRIYEGNPDYGATGWEIGLAKDMIESGKGNCYSFSAVFWALARGIGYEPRAISGKCLEDEQPHSWCMLELDGDDYIFDPQWQYNYTERGIDHYDMFMIPRDQFYIWLYQWDE